MSYNPISEAIEVFLEVKDKVIKDDRELGSKVRTRSREGPEMILTLGITPTLSFYLSKAGLKTLEYVVKTIKSNHPEQKGVKKEDLSYAIYSYVILKYLCKYLPTVEAKDVYDLVEKGGDKLYKLLSLMVKGESRIPVYRLLIQYLQQFKRLCEASFEPERGR